MIEKLLLKLRARDDVSAEEEDILRGLVADTKEVAADVTVVRAQVDLSVSNILLAGLMCRYKDLYNGERQITELHVPGDFVDLHSFPLKRLDHNVMALVPCKIALVPHDRLHAITETHPHLTRLLWFMTTLDAAIHREWELSLGRRTSSARIAHVLCELHTRFQIVGMTQGYSYRLPLTQFDLAECLGLTAIHVNRTLRELRMSRLVTFRNKTVVIENFAGLAKLAEYDSDYLYVDKRPR
ncbi:Crp/Fnr family transcriptional regulator [Sphingomonas sp. PAMC 26605]|uniref:Crp/Fnr family transcriptional regulator n=1 Tax=Sphingomonas sp. PAMC 26605 TaxID=1112214 RepID=UPI00026CB125|nr:Crp/Fnr family transcriptional regulator [Sphingomonas sp. PAMC 26605]